MTVATDKETIGRAIGRMVSGIYIVTTGYGSQKQGMLASWVIQAGFEPPMLTVAVQQDRQILESLESSKKFIVNVLSDANSNLMGPFAKFKPEQFEGLSILEKDHGVVLQDTVAYLSCELREKWAGGDHYILLGEIVEGEILNGDLQPWSHLRKNGFVY